MKISITLSANAGVAMEIYGRRIWIDALHDQKQAGFSTVDSQLQVKMLNHAAFSKPDYICYTHCHGDHFSKELTAAAVNLWPGAAVILPEKMLDHQLLITGKEWLYNDGELSLRFIKLTHEGEVYRNCIHYGMLISVQGKHILIAGDCETASPVLADAICGEKIDMVLLNFPWITLKKGRAFVQEYLKTAKIVLYHLPFAADDGNGYRDATEKAVKAFDSNPVLTLCEPLQQIIVDI